MYLVSVRTYSHGNTKARARYSLVLPYPVSHASVSFPLCKTANLTTPSHTFHRMGSKKKTNIHIFTYTHTCTQTSIICGYGMDSKKTEELTLLLPTLHPVCKCLYTCLCECMYLTHQSLYIHIRIHACMQKADFCLSAPVCGMRYSSQAIVCVCVCMYTYGYAHTCTSGALFWRCRYVGSKQYLYTCVSICMSIFTYIHVHTCRK